MAVMLPLRGRSSVFSFFLYWQDDGPRSNARLGWIETFRSFRMNVQFDDSC